MKLKFKLFTSILITVFMLLGICLTGCETPFLSESSSSESSQDDESSAESSSSESSSSESESSSSESSSSKGESSSSDQQALPYYYATVKSNANVSASPYVGGATVPEELEGIYYSSDAPGGNPENDGTGNIWLTLKPLKKYGISKIKIEGQYEKIEIVGKDIYCIYGVESNLIVTTTVATMPSVDEELFEEYGYGISDDGVLSVTWKENPQNPLRYFEIVYSSGTGYTTQYVDAGQGIAELMSMTENKIYGVSVRAVGLNSVGKQVDFSACYMVEPKDVSFPRIEITTEDYVWPSCDFVGSPEGCWGAGITNAFYEQCVMNMYNKDNELVYTSALDQNEKFLGAKLKIRGNTSARYSSNGRFPYKLKLDEKFDLLEPLIGRPNDGKAYADKDWVLLNYGNDGYRICGDAIADAVGREWSPDYCYVALYLNGEYRGLYVLSEAVEEGSGTEDEKWRVNVDDDGYVFECDAYWWNEDLYFSTPMTENTPMYFTFKYPDADKMDENSPEYQYLKNYMIEFEAALKKNDDSYLDYIDLDSFVKWLLVSDYLCISDGGGCNLFLYKKDSTSETKIAMGPNWDFDSYMGDYNALATIRIYWNEAPFYYHQLIKKESFQKRYKELFAQTYEILDEYVEQAFAQIDESAHSQLLNYDNMRFGTSTKSLSTRKEAFLAWLEDHLEWMETQFK